MIYWKIRFDGGHEGTGWLVLDDEMRGVKLTDDDGIEIETAVDYTTIDTEAEPPEWA